VTFVISLNKGNCHTTVVTHFQINFLIFFMETFGVHILCLSGHKYFPTLVDYYSRFSWIKFMNNKSETKAHLIQFVSMIEIQFNSKLKIVSTDNRVEYLLNDFFLLKRHYSSTNLCWDPLTKWYRWTQASTYFEYT